MACQALGRCRICARKHKIDVFGGEKAQHFFIEKANLKLIILNTVCISCIAKIEKFVDKMDLETVFGGSKSPDKPATSLSFDSESEKKFRRIEKEIKTEEFDLETDYTSGSRPMDIGHHQKENPVDVETTSICSTCTLTDMQSRSTHNGDSQTARNFPHHTQSERGEEPCRKRPRNSTKIVGNLNTTSADNCVKKVGRLLRCDYCKKEFTHAGDLNKHRRKHTGEKPYECNQCKRKFAHASNLARHQRVHSGERPFGCTICGKTFTRRDKLAIHITAKRCEPNKNESQFSPGLQTAEIKQS